MRFEQMQEFVKLAENCNYLETAEDLYISQATLSRHIKEMEAELGCSLFKRSTRKVSLTNYGMLLLPYAREALELEQRYMNAIASQREKDHHAICIGAFTKTYDSGVSNLIAGFQKLQPEAHIQMSWNESDDLLNSLTKEFCDFIFVREAPSDRSDTLERIPIAKDSLKVFLSKDHPLAKNTSIQIGQLRHEPFFMTEDTSLTSKMTMDTCRNAGFIPDVLLHGSKQQIFNMLSKGLGVSLLFKGNHTTYEESQSVVSIDLEPKVIASINLVYRKSHKLTPVQSSFLQFVQAYSKEHFDDKFNSNSAV